MGAYTERGCTISATLSAEISATLSADNVQSDTVSSGCRQCGRRKEEEDEDELHWQVCSGMKIFSPNNSVLRLTTLKSNKQITAQPEAGPGSADQT